MSQTKWPLSSLPILKLDDLGAKQACEVLYTTCYEMIRHLPTVDSLFSTMPDYGVSHIFYLLIFSVTKERRTFIRLYLLYSCLRIIRYNGTIMRQ